ncbi:MAG: 3,5-nucleoside bisphosphate phosphatase [Candidatus Petromonas sp.]|jgi:PHP family Zn ribbon phosphoesterase|nr:3,5-nucleoside bisphosphate phosphatase [Candidatus Petromonas sp.]
MNLYYDFHIHTALSPCGDRDMTPNNIVNMATIKGLDAIAITDHNTVRNCLPCVEVAKKTDLTVIPGMEIQTKEEVHLLCMFRNIETAILFEKAIDSHMIKLQNNPKFFGKQLIFDKYDNVIGEEKRLLSSSVNMSINEVFHTLSDMGGIVIPAHIDKKAYSIISNLGFMPMDLGITTVEFSKGCNKEKFIKSNNYIKKYRIIRNSDAHYLGDISERTNYLNVKKKDIHEIFKVLSSQVI